MGGGVQKRGWYYMSICPRCQMSLSIGPIVFGGNPIDAVCTNCGFHGSYVVYGNIAAVLYLRSGLNKDEPMLSEAVNIRS